MHEQRCALMNVRCLPCSNALSLLIVDVAAAVREQNDAGKRAFFDIQVPKKLKMCIIILHVHEPIHYSVGEDHFVESNHK